MPTTITVCDGATTIGGNKILLESDGRALFFDFGLCYSKYGDYYAEFLTPKSVRGIYDFLVMGLLPPIKGIYREELIPGAPLEGRLFPERARELEVNAILLSHAHGDHIGYVSFVRSDIPIVCSPVTAFAAKAIQDAAKSDVQSEFCYTKPKTSNESGTISSLRGGSAVQRPFKLFGLRDELSNKALEFWKSKFTSTGELQSLNPEPCRDVAGLRVCSYPVDHSIYGASAFAVETSDGWVVYTGDLRMHGKNGRLTQDFVEAAAKLEPVALIVEGTHVNAETHTLEETARDNCLSAVRAADGKLVIADFGPRNVERLESFLDIARETNRLLVIMGKDALLLHAMHLVDPEVPDSPADPLICIYDEPRGKSDGWLKWVCEQMRGKLVSPEDIRNSPGKYILCFSFFDINDLAEIAPENGGVYIYSNSKLYDEEQEIDFGRLRNWLDRFGLTLIGDPEDESSNKLYHASGHISGPELEKLVRTIDPKALIPVHTEPKDSYDWFDSTFSRDLYVIFPEEMQPISLR